MTIVLNLPWPDGQLSPNARIHWKKRAPFVKRARGEAMDYALLNGVRPYDFKGVDKIHATITFSPPDKRPRDTDNMIASIKPYIDGIAELIRVDDSKWKMTFEREEPSPPSGGVRFEISPIVASESRLTKSDATEGI